MHPESRNRTDNRYVYRSERKGNRVRKRYLGSAKSDFTELRLRLTKLQEAMQQASVEKLRAEQQAAEPTGVILERLSVVISHWKVLFGLARLTEQLPQSPVNVESENLTENLSYSSKPQSLIMIDLNLPGLHKFRRLCRQANDGDREAQAELDQLLAQHPAIVRESLDFTEIAKRELMESLGGNRADARQLLEHLIASETKQLRGSIQQHPLGPLVAEVCLLAWLDTLRCQLGAIRNIQTVELQKFWDRAKKRAFDRLEKVQKHVDAIRSLPVKAKR